jgi:acyl-CoA synthetase (AMP-forming)/AMP-acid ligase II
VAVLLPRGSELVAAVLGALQAGAAVLPLDPELPKPRLALLCQQAGATHLLAAASADAAFFPAQDAVQRLPAPDTTARAALDRASAAGEALLGVSLDPQGLLRAGGSTHAALAEACAAGAERLSLGDGGLAVAGLPSSNPLSLVELLLPLSVGARVWLPPPGVLSAPAPGPVDVRFAFAEQLLELPPQAAGVRLVIAGEPPPEALVARAASAGARVFNAWGSAAAGFLSVLDELTAKGTPALLRHAEAQVLGAGGAPAGLGVPGELWLSGAPTGQRARLRPDGRLERYRGRGQGLVLEQKGVRVDPRAVERCLAQHPAIAEVAVLARPAPEGTERLAAYLVLRPGMVPTETELRRLVRAELPQAATPAAFVEVPVLPRTPSGRVDPERLPASPFTVSARAHQPPRTDAERLLAAIWKELLGVEAGAGDNFFELGGHSLLVFEVLARVEKRTGRRLGPRTLLLSTLGQAAAELAQLK